MGGGEVRLVGLVKRFEDVTAVAGRKLAALECHASQADAKQELADLRAQLEADGAIYEGYTRVRPIVPAPHPVFDAALL